MECGPNFGGVLCQHPMKKVSYLNYEHRYQFVAEICFILCGFWCSKAYEGNYSITMPFGGTLLNAYLL